MVLYLIIAGEDVSRYMHIIEAGRVLHVTYLKYSKNSELKFLIDIYLQYAINISSFIFYF
jgi:hypothetical protein